MSDQENEEEKFEGWLNSFPEYVSPDDGKLYIIRKPDDMDQVFDELERMIGD